MFFMLIELVLMYSYSEFVLNNCIIFVFVWIVVHHKTTPKFEDIPAAIRDVMLRAISINSGYTSRVMVKILVS